jgi:hypothetical protein
MDLFALIMFDFRLLLLLVFVILLGMWAQYRVRSTYAAAQQIPCRLSGAAAAQYILQSAGVGKLGIQEIGGRLSDHYDPREKVLRLSSDVFHGRNLAAVGIAAHEAGHAIQDARNYAPLVIRNAAVPAASFGSNASFLLLILGMLFSFQPLILAGIALFGCVVFFQLVNLPVEFNASSRAKAELVNLGVVNAQELTYVRRVLSAAALIYVAATLQAVLTLLYYIMMFTNRRS